MLRLLCLSFIVLAPGLAAQLPVAPRAGREVALDDQKSRFFNFEVGPVAPLLLSADGARLFALNQGGARLAIFDAATMTLQGEVALGLGAASLARRPGTDELWVVDRVGSCVTIVDPARRTIVRTIRVGAEPHGIDFTDDGDRAYVTCSAVDRVDVVRTSDYAVVREIPIPAREPRAIVHVDGRTFVASFRSGNNTAGQGSAGFPDAVLAVAKVEGPGVTPLPDRDLFVIPRQASPEQDALDPAATVTGLGTTLFNLHRRPGTSELWIPNTDALNDVHRSEANFVGGQVVSNRITIVDATGAAPPRFVDLDALAPPDRKCAQPSAIAFDPTRLRVYVCGYGSDLVAVLQMLEDGGLAWLGSIELPAEQEYPRGTGPRGALIDPQGRWLYVYDKVDSAISRIDLLALPASGVYHVVAAPPTALGHELVSDEERLGRHLFTNARFSKSQTSSCASCHVDGNTDGLAWDLSHYLDPEGTPDAALAFPLDLKGPMVTQSTRRLAETSPYHWRGDKRTLDDFNATFATLLDHEVGGAPADIGAQFRYLKHFVDRMAIPANPRQRLDRRLSDEELQGADLFLHEPVLGTLACADCHPLPLGSAGEIVALTTGGIPRTIDVPSLRGVADKLSPVHVAGGAFGTLTELGAGVTHAGAFSALEEVILRHTPAGAPAGAFALNSFEARAIAQFLAALDTGLAPSTAFQATVRLEGTAIVGQEGLDFLLAQAREGHCEVVCYRTPANGAPPSTGLHDPETQTFRVASAGGAPVDVAALLAEAAAGAPVTFLGVPLGSGLCLALDRDLDGLFDLDELALGTDHERWDSDGDTFPDGYEALWGMDPSAPDGSSPDQVAPTLVGPARLVYATTNTLKLEFTTSEYTRVYVSYNGGPIVQRLPLSHPADFEHYAVVSGLEPNTDYALTFVLRDPAGNTTTDSTTVFHTASTVTPSPCYVRAIALAAGGVPATLAADVTLETGPQVPAVGYTVRASAYRLYWTGHVEGVASGLQAATDGGGVAALQALVPAASVAGPSTLFFVVDTVVPPSGGVPYAVGSNLVAGFASIAF